MIGTARDYIFLFYFGLNLIACESLEMFQSAPNPKPLTALVIDYKNVNSNLEEPLELAIFFVKKPYLIKSNSDRGLQQLALEEELLRHQILTYYRYDVIPKQVITDKIEVATNAKSIIALLKQGQNTISKAECNIEPKEIKVISIKLIDTKIKITRNK